MKWQALTVLLFLQIAAAHAGTLEEQRDITLRYYDITGMTAKELRQELDTKGPQDQFGQARDAYTHWHIRWSWPVRQGRPAYDKIEVSYEIEVTLPRYVESSETEAGLRKRWKEYLKAVHDHELGHIEIVREHYEEVRREVLRAVESNPRLSARDANAAARKVLEKIRGLDLKYDRETESGRVQGVRFP